MRILANCRSLWAVSLCAACLSACAGSKGSTPSSNAAIDRWEDPTRDGWSQPDRVVESLALGQEPLYIVDLGAGSGYFSRRLAKANPQGEVLALEVSRAFRTHIESHREAWGTPNLKTRLVINNNPLLREGSVDLVFMSNTYRFLEERSRYLDDLRTALTDKGRIAIVDFRKDANCAQLPECPPPRERVAKSKVIEEMQAAGFAQQADHDYLGHQYYLVFAPAAKSVE